MINKDKHAEWTIRKRQSARKIDRLTCKNKARRRRLEANDEKWLLHYLPDAFPLPFGHFHRLTIQQNREVVDEGGKGLVIGPRGGGKTSIFYGLTLKDALTGKCKFPAYLPWKAREIRKALRFWKNALCYNQRLLDDYPDFCQPFAVSKGSSQKCKTLLWSDTMNPTGAELLLSDGMIIFPDSRGAIGSSTINGNPRGLNHSTEDGGILRPTKALIDDPQSKEVAKSPQQVEDTIEIIENDVAGMAGPDARMPMLLLGTILKADDVVDQLSRREDWTVVKVGQIMTWPKNMDLWTRFGALVKEQKEPEALVYYRANKAALIQGMTVSWDERYDRKRGEPDAFYSAMRDFYFLGEKAFMTERQGEPPVENVTTQYDLTVERVEKQVIPLDRLQVPLLTSILVGKVDVNRAGLHWMVAAFDQSMTGHCPAYGKWPQRGDLWAENAPEQVIQQAIFEGLKGLCDALVGTVFTRNGQPFPLKQLNVDRGFKPEAIHRFAQVARYPFIIVPDRGYAAQKYFVSKASLVGAPFEGCHITRNPQGDFLAFNADAWRETMQRAFMAEPGSRGGFTLYRPRSAGEHRTLAEHIVAERLKNKYLTDGGWRWEWEHAPGVRKWDLGDACTGCWVAAASRGLKSGGDAAAEQHRTERRAGGVTVIQM